MATKKPKLASKPASTSEGAVRAMKTKAATITAGECERLHKVSNSLIGLAVLVKLAAYGEPATSHELAAYYPFSFSGDKLITFREELDKRFETAHKEPSRHLPLNAEVEFTIKDLESLEEALGPSMALVNLLNSDDLGSENRVSQHAGYSAGLAVFVAQEVLMSLRTRMEQKGGAR